MARTARGQLEGRHLLFEEHRVQKSEVACKRRFIILILNLSNVLCVSLVYPKNDWKLCEAILSSGKQSSLQCSR